MKKLLATPLAILIILAIGAAFAQSASHDVTIKIPDVVYLEIVNAAGTVGTPAVTFDFVTNSTPYINMVNGGGGALSPTGVTDFEDVIVFSNRASWSVSVSTSAIGFTDDVVAGLTGNGLGLGDIKVNPNTTSGRPTTGVTSVDTSWDLATPANPIATGTATLGASSLGFSGHDYTVDVQGDEDPGTYQTTVTYTLTSP